MGRWLAGCMGALRFLTRLPLPAALAPASPDLSRALGWFPAVGLLLGAILAGLDALLRPVLGVPLTSGIVVVGLLLLTGGLHADGLMDTCDAVFSHATPERRLEIMRDSRSGAFGVLGGVSLVLLKTLALAALPLAVRPDCLLLAPALGRWSIVLASAAFPYGRPGGLSASFGAAPRLPTLAFASLACVVAGLLAGLWSLPLLLVPLAATLGIGAWLMRLLPGLTGDCYGALCEVSETLVLIVGAPLAVSIGVAR